MKAGCAMETITPALPVMLAGFGVQRKAEDVHDDLYVKVVLLKAPDGYYGVISYDLLCVDGLLLERLKTGMDEMSLDSSRFLITATHTHSGPCGIMETGEGLARGMACVAGVKDTKLVEAVALKTLEALKRAVENCQETKIRIARGSLRGLGMNRNNRALTGDEDVFAAELVQETGSKVLLVNAACHPTVLNHENVSVSADFPGAVNRLMAEEGYAFTLYLNGSCGDISTRFTRKGKGFPEVERYGHLLADKLKEMLLEARAAAAEKVSIESFQVQLKLKKPDDLEHAEKELKASQKRVDEAVEQGIEGSELRLIESGRDGALMSLHYARNAPLETFQTVTISVLQVNEELFAGVPGELFSELSNRFKNEHVHFVGYAGGYYGYFADEAAYDCLNYESLSSPFERGQPEILMEQIGRYIYKKRKEA